MFEEMHSQIAHTRCCEEFHSFKAARLKITFDCWSYDLKNLKAKIIWETLYVERNSFQTLISS